MAAITGKFAADFTPFFTAVQQADASLKEFQAGAGRVGTSLDAMANQFSGKKVIEQATLMEKAFQDLTAQGIGLTTAELERMGRTATEASEKMRAMGIEVPPGIQKIADATKAVQKSTEGAKEASVDWAGSLKDLAASVGVGFSIGAIVEFGKAVVEAGSQINDMSERLDISTDAVQGFKYAAEQTGTTLDAVGTAINKMNEKLSGGDKATVGALKELHINFQAIRDMKPEDAFLAITDALQRVNDPMDQARLRTELLGKAAKELGPAITEGFRKLAEEAPKMSKEAIAACDQVGDAWNRLSATVKAKSAEIIASSMDMANGVRSSWASIKLFAAQALTGSGASALAWAGALEAGTRAAQANHDVNLTLPGPIHKTKEEMDAAAAAAKKYADEFNAMVGKFSSAAAQQQMKMLDAVFKQLSASGKLTKEGMAELAKEAENLSNQGARLSPRLLDLVLQTGDLAPKMSTAAVNFSDFGTKVSDALPKLDAFNAAVVDLDSKTIKFTSDFSRLNIPKVTEMMPPAIVKVESLSKSLGELSQAFTQLATTAGGSLGSVVSSLGTFVTATNTAVKGMGAFKDGQKAFNAGDMLTGITGMVSGIMAITSAAIAAGKAIWNLFSTQGRDKVVDFASSMGGFDALHEQLNTLGAEGEKLWVTLTQGVARNNPTAAQAAIDAVTAALDKQKQAQQDAAAASTVTTEAQAQATIETSAEAARALDDVTARLATNQDAWGAWSTTVTGYLQDVANAVRAVPVPGPLGPVGGSSVSAGTGLVTAGSSPSLGGTRTNQPIVVQVDGMKLLEVVATTATNNGVTRAA
jgi:hypothetical protein